MAELIFLGTAGDTAVVSKQLRSSGGIILQVENLQFHLDPGPGALVKAKEYGLNVHHTSAILVSHNHINHCNDLNVIVDAMTHGGIEQRGIILGSKSVVQPQNNSSPFLTSHHLRLVEKIIALEKNHKIGLDLVEINALPIVHEDETAIGFKFLCPKFILSYLSDTIVTEELLEHLQGSDVLILNVPYPAGKAKNKNLDSEQAAKIISAIKPRLALLTHFGLEMLKADPLQEAREIQRKTGIQTIAACDGLIISPDNYGKAKSPIRGWD